MTSTHGVSITGSILDKIVEDKRDQLEKRKKSAPEAALRQEFEEFALGTPRGLSLTLTNPPSHAPQAAAVQVIAEIKRASPSKGMLAPELEWEYPRIAREYTLAGAAGISVVTERNHFFGDMNWLRNISVQLDSEFGADRPSLLRKDFLVDPYEVVEARAFGADNVLLIVAMLEQSLLVDLLASARSLGLDALVVVNNEAEAERAIAAGTTLYGINNRNLHNFEVDLGVTERIRPLLPADAIVVGESGVGTKAHVERLAKAGVRAILVGEAFMTSDDIAGKMAELRL